jgi:hypothetical protein
MPQQLLLIEPEPQVAGRPAGEAVPSADDWHLDAQTREAGLRGIAEARRILAESARRAEERSAA